MEYMVFDTFPWTNMRILWDGNRGWTIIAVSRINGGLLSRTVGYGSFDSAPQSGIGDRRIFVANRVRALQPYRTGQRDGPLVDA